MAELLVQIGLNNVCCSLALALVALMVGTATKRPRLSHLLWLFVLIKIITPPVVTIPVITLDILPKMSTANSQSSLIERSSIHLDPNNEPGLSTTFPSTHTGFIVMNRVLTWLPSIWMLGSAVILVGSMIRVARFNHLLATESGVAPSEVYAVANSITRRLGLDKVPLICLTHAHLSPMVWWVGGRVKIILPAALLDRMEEQQWQWILAHELAHVRRHDYLVRWLEWLACVVFWWNPVVWWAQHNLRAMEEICCDDLVISCLNPKPKSYAQSIFLAVEFLALPVLRPPAIASEINSGGNLERRFKMILSKNRNRQYSYWLHAGVLIGALAVLPLGIATAQDSEAVAKRLKEAVKQGEITPKQADAMMGALKKKDTPGKSDMGKESIDKKSAAIDKVEKLAKEKTKEKQAEPKKIKIGKDSATKDERDINEIGKELKAAVKAGKLTKEEAVKKWTAIQKEASAKKEKDYDTKSQKLKNAAASGKQAKEQALDKQTEPKKMKTGKDNATKDERDINEIGKELKAAVKAGKITKEQARDKWAHIQKLAKAKEKQENEGDTIAEKLKAEVKAGRLTKEEALNKLRAMKEKASTKDKDNN